MSKKMGFQLLVSFIILSISVLVYTAHTRAVDLPVTGSAGSVDDPLVTKSYVDEQIRELLGDQSGGGQTGNSGAPGPGSDAIANSDIVVLQLQQGQTLYGGAGAEFVVRTGQAVVYTTDPNGIADLTAGKDVLNGEPVELNHLLLFPRDGRAIKPDVNNQGDIYVIVRGSHILLDQDGNEVKLP